MDVVEAAECVVSRAEREEAVFADDTEIGAFVDVVDFERIAGCRDCVVVGERDLVSDFEDVRDVLCGKGCGVDVLWEVVAAECVEVVGKVYEGVAGALRAGTDICCRGCHEVLCLRCGSA